MTCVAPAPHPSDRDLADDGAAGRSANPNGVADRLLRAIRWYQRGAEGRPSPCRFFPSCSAYAHEAIEAHGAGRGLILACRRLLRCRPFGPSGFDPVPDPLPHRKPIR